MTQPTQLRPLPCSSCGSVLALGQGKSARCPYCKAETPIPAEYGALQRAAQSFADDRRLATQLYGTLGKPPGWFARAVGSGAEKSVGIGSVVGGVLIWLMLANPLIGLAALMAAAYALGFPAAAIIRGIAWLSHDPISGPLSPFAVLPAAMVLVVIVVGIPAIRFGRERELADVRASVHASLAAKVPERAGGPSLCRTCGAGLDVPSGALGVPCPYCKSDNLVALPPEWVAQVRGKEFRHFLQIDAALEEFRLVNERARELMWKVGLGFVLVFPLVLMLAWFLDAARINF